MPPSFSLNFPAAESGSFLPTRPFLFVSEAVSDHHLVRMVLSEIDSPLPVRFSSTCAGFLADLQNIENGDEVPPTMIFIDFFFGGYRGLDLLKQIRQSPVLKTVPVMILLPGMFERLMNESYEAGANCCLIIPTDFFELGDTLKGIFNFWLSYKKVG